MQSLLFAATAAGTAASSSSATTSSAAASATTPAPAATASASASASTATKATTTATTAAPSTQIVFTVSADEIAVVAIIFVYAVAITSGSIAWRALSKPDSGWSLGRALSETDQISATPTPPTHEGDGAAGKGGAEAGGAQPPQAQAPASPPSGELQTILVPSTSRLIAFLGLLIMLSLYLGGGTVAIWNIAHNVEVGWFDKFTGFLYSGIVLFAPYLANQVNAAVKAIAGKG